MQPFTLQDLGLIKTPDFKNDYDARFETKPQAKAAYFYASPLTRFKTGIMPDINALYGSRGANLNSLPNPECQISQIARGKLILKIGRSYERFGDKDRALDIYENSYSLECNKFIIHLRYSEGHKS